METKSKGCWENLNLRSLPWKLSNHFSRISFAFPSCISSCQKTLVLFVFLLWLIQCKRGDALFTMLPQCFKLDRQAVKILQKEIKTGC